MPLDLIAFTGLAQAGKTTSANAIVRAYGFTRMSFADPIRAMLLALGVSADDLTITKERPLPEFGFKTARYLMQTLGTEWMRNTVCAEGWLNAMRLRIEMSRRAGICAGVVIDDCRFDNEAALIRSLGGVVVKVERAGLIEQSSHASEAGVNPAFDDAVLKAPDGGVADLEKAAVKFFDEFNNEA